VSTPDTDPPSSRKQTRSLSQLRGTHRWTQLKAAFRRLPLRVDGARIHGLTVEEHLLVACDRLAGFPNHGPIPSDTPFRPASRKTTRAELERLAQLADALTDHVESHMHEPAILALAGAGIVRGSVILFARAIAESARRTDLSRVAEKVGRGNQQSRQRTMLAAQLLYEDFRLLTGRDPKINVTGTRAGGRFIALLQEAFSILSIDGSAESVARELIKEKRGSTK
jgi:hypothetical protein